MELRLPPVVQAILAALLMVGTGYRWPYQPLHLPWLSVFLAGAGAVFLAAPVASFVKARTTVDPMQPERAEKLVISGTYRMSRNPMYVGMALLLGAVAAWSFLLPHLFVIAVFLIWMTRFQIIPEERALERRFGEQYLEYKRRVRRWL